MNLILLKYFINSVPLEISINNYLIMIAMIIIRVYYFAMAYNKPPQNLAS